MKSEQITGEVRLLIDAKNEIGECVLWCDRMRCVWWTDIASSMLWRHQPDSGVTRSWPMPERVGSFALTENEERLLLGLASGLAWFDLPSGRVRHICKVEAELPSTRLNDGRCDRQGRFVFGTCDEARPKSKIGSFYRLNTDLSLEKLPLPTAAIPNSICFSRRGDRLFYCDSTVQSILACDYDPMSGEVGAPRLFADLAAEPGVPDGSAIDAEDFLWNAQWGGSRLVRYAPDGKVDRILSVPALQPSCVAFGGANLDELFISSAREDIPQEALRRRPDEGGLFHSVMAGIRGLPESRFAGVW
ncbi:SMP-30/gluconolactonase/LRE family protein [soil metagenome]